MVYGIIGINEQDRRLFERVFTMFKDKEYYKLERKLAYKSIEWIVDNLPENIVGVDTNGFRLEPLEDRVREIEENLVVLGIVPTTFVVGVVKNFDGVDELTVSDYILVDGLHRLRALRDLKKNYLDIYDNIKDREMLVVFIQGLDLEGAVRFYLEMNSTSLDMSSYYAIYKSKVADYEDIVKEEYKYSENLKVGLVKALVKLNNNEYSVWHNRIGDGDGKLSIIAFDKSLRHFVLEAKRLGYLYGSLSVSQYEDFFYMVLNTIWSSLYDKWTSLFKEVDCYGHINPKNAIQTEVGVRAIGYYLAKGLSTVDGGILNAVVELIDRISPSVQVEDWYFDGSLGVYTTKMGSRVIAHILEGN